MGVTFGGKKFSGGVAFNGKKLSGIAYKGDIILYQPKVEIVTFADGTDEQISAMLDAHYKGKINIEDYWSVGDTRTVQLTNLGSSGTQVHVDQKMIMIIIGFNHDNLENKQGIRDKAAVTIQCKDALGNNEILEGEYYWGREYKAENGDNYTKSPLRNWLNENFINSMPSSFNSMIKTVNKKNLAYHNTANNAPLISKDKAFLLSYPEVFGTVKYDDYIENKEVGEYEGTKYEYFKSSSERYRKINNDGSIVNNSEWARWWLRSPASVSTQLEYSFCSVGGGYPSRSYSYPLALIPAFCL